MHRDINLKLQKDAKVIYGLTKLHNEVIGLFLEKLFVVVGLVVQLKASG